MTARIASGGKKINPSILKISKKTSFNYEQILESLKIIKKLCLKLLMSQKELLLIQS